MLTVDEALSLILREVQPFPPQRVPIVEAFGLALAEDVVSEVDSPPFDKSLMDGFAVRSGDVTAGAALKIIEEVAAGRVPTKPVRSGEATRVMTGAPIPDGADAVLPVEQTDFDARQVRIISAKLAPGSNVLRRGAA
ncbi:MAG: gephyrin-like molybdotransferase Glp, partial [Planctomycetaceae bacterium]